MSKFNYNWDFLKQLFCRHHEYKKIGWSQEIDQYRNVRYPLRYYRCKHCGKEISVDGRYDKLSGRVDLGQG